MKGSFLKALGEPYPLVMDGAMGTMLLDAAGEECLENLNLTRGNLVRSIHQSYRDAGAEIIETNTFGGNRLKLSQYGLAERIYDINFKAVKLAREAAKGYAWVAGSVGPTGGLLEPLGELTFDEALEIFKEQVLILEKAGVDLITLETMTDIQEMRAALIAVKENTSLPVIAHLAFAEEGVTVTGTDPKTAVVVLEALGADLIGANCSSGPEPLLKVLSSMKEISRLPLSVMPNAGLPEIADGKAVYQMKPKTFAEFAARFAEMGVKVIGGCCGTTPDHIREISRRVKKRGSRPSSIVPHPSSPVTRLANRSRTVEVSENLPPILIGERINPTARKAMAEELRQGKTVQIREEAVAQVKAGADMLDVNVGVGDIDEVAAMEKAVQTIQQAVSVPLSLDSANPAVLEAGLKTCAGKALINSVNGEKKSLKAILPLAKKYGAAIIGLTVDERGIPKTAAERLAIARKIVGAAEKIGIRREDIFIDCVVLAVSAGQKEAIETLRAIPLIKEKLKVRISLGVSNVSFGLPGRRLINRAYLAMVLGQGLDAAIANPLDPEAHEIIAASAALTGRDDKARQFIAKFGAVAPPTVKKKPPAAPGTLENIKRAVIEGNSEIMVDLVEAALGQGEKAQNIIDRGMVPAMEEVGEKFGSGEYFLPQVMASAEAMKRGFTRAKQELGAEEVKVIGTGVIATVKGDIHDIGKNMVAMMLENNGFRVIDLGKNVAADEIVAAVKKHRAQVVLLSSLLTTTMPQMAVVKEKLKEAGLKIPVMVGGAAVTDGFARKMSANFARDAIEAVRVAKTLVARLPASPASRQGGRGESDGQANRLSHNPSK